MKSMDLNLALNPGYVVAVHILLPDMDLEEVISPWNKAPAELGF
jgi:hypothetical protein